MARRPSKTLTDGELRIMRVLWRDGSSTVREVTEGLDAEAEVAYNTVQTMLGILVEKGYLVRRRAGRAFVYEARVSRHAAQAQALGHLLQEFFDGSRRELVHSLVEPVDELELAELRSLLSQDRADDETPDETPEESGGDPEAVE